MDERIEITTEYITLGQLLKLAGLIGSGGDARVFLAETQVAVNGEQEDRRGRKLRVGNIVVIEGVGEIEISRTNDDSPG